MARRKVVDAHTGKVVQGDYPEVKPKRRGRARKSDGTDGVYLKWWLAAPDQGKDAAATLWRWVDRQRATWAMDASEDITSEAIYNDSPVTPGGGLSAFGRWTGPTFRNPINKIKSLVDTATARLTKVRSMPVISADDADYEEARFAREQSRVLRRKMGNGDMELAAPLVIRDFIIRSVAYGKVERCNGDTEFRRVPSYEVLYDHREALHVQPDKALSQRAHVRPEDRDKLIAKYPHAEAVIRDAPAFTRGDIWMSYAYTGPNMADMVEVAESWHPATTYDADDGQWILCVRGAVVARAPWKCTRDPLVPVWWTPPTRGQGRGTGLVYEMSEAQGMVNDILADAREAIHAASQVKVFQPRQGGANKHHLKARHAAIIEYDGAPPTYIAPDPVSKQAWAIAFQILGEMDAMSGIAQWASQAKAPLGANASGKALDTMDDMQSDRFAHVESGWQQFRVGIGLRHVDVARMMHDEANGKTKKIYDEQPDPLTEDDLAAWIRDNSWPDVDIDGGDYHLTLEPENFITGTRGGKLNEVNEAAKAGLIPDPSMTAAMFDEPDIARWNRGIIGPVHRIQRCMSDLADLSVPYLDCAPDPVMNRGLAKLEATGELEELKSKRPAADDKEGMKAYEARLQRFVDFLDDCKRLDDLAASAQQQQQAPSLQGAQANNIVAQSNAGDLMGGGGGPPPAGPPPGGAPMPPGQPS